MNKNKTKNSIKITIINPIRKSIYNIKTILILLITFLALSHHAKSQDFFAYELNKNKTEFGITLGGLIPLYYDIEAYLSINRRVSSYAVLEGKPLVGYIHQLFVFDDDDSYNMVYGGGTIGLNIGKKNKFLEVAIGPALFYNYSDNWGSDRTRIVPIGNIGYKNAGRKFTFRTGMGFPQFVYVSFGF